MQTKTILLSALVLMTISFCFSLPIPVGTQDVLLFKKFAQDYNKEYKDDTEMLLRFKIFQESLQTIKELNAKHPHSIRCQQTSGSSPEAKVAPPSSLDWRAKGVITPVKDQGSCGGCWSFSTSGAVEAANAIKTGKLVSLSEQQLIDCSQGCSLIYGQSVCNTGCGGGLMWTAMNDIISMGGLESESSYPFTMSDGTCSFDKSKNYTCVSSPAAAADEGTMASIIATSGPVSIALDATPLKFYSGGVLVPASDGSTCSTTQLDHALLIVGYGADSTAGDYWIVKNSWSSNWGENGFFRIARGVGACGLNTAVVIPVV